MFPPYTCQVYAFRRQSSTFGYRISWTVEPSSIGITSVMYQPELEGESHGLNSSRLDCRREPYRVRADAPWRSHLHQRHRADSAKELPVLPPARFDSPDVAHH